MQAVHVGDRFGEVSGPAGVEERGMYGEKGRELERPMLVPPACSSVGGPDVRTKGQSIGQRCGIRIHNSTRRQGEPVTWERNGRTYAAFTANTSR